MHARIALRIVLLEEINNVLDELNTLHMQLTHLASCLAEQTGVTFKEDLVGSIP